MCQSCELILGLPNPFKLTFVFDRVFFVGVVVDSIEREKWMRHGYVFSVFVNIKSVFFPFDFS